MRFDPSRHARACHPLTAFVAIALAACSSPQPVTPLDGAPQDVDTTDVSNTDVSSPDAASADVTPADIATPPDVASPDAEPPPPDAPPADAPPPPDAAPPPPDAPPPPPDAPRPVDAASPDVSVMDVAPPPDAPRPPDAPPPPDAPRPPDAPPPPPDAALDARLDAAPDAPLDVARPPDSTCAGAFAITVTTPTANQEIETCTRGGAPVYFDFTATAPGATSMEFAFRTPMGALAPPAVPPDTSAPFTVRRQVGGPMTDMVPLATFGLRGTWYFEVTGRDACGRSAMTRQPFTLIYTNRMCPNP